MSPEGVQQPIVVESYGAKGMDPWRTIIPQYR
jgi:hypothetical protein